MGNVLSVAVHAANIHDTQSGILPARKAFRKHPTLARFCGDMGYRKTFCEDVSRELGAGVDISERISPVFAVIPKRWVVERTLGWLTHSRRLSKDFEITTASEENWVMISHMHTLAKRFAKL